MDQQQFGSFIRYRGPAVVRRQEAFEEVNLRLEHVFAAYLAYLAADPEDEARRYELHSEAYICLGLLDHFEQITPGDDANHRTIKDGGRAALGRAHHILTALGRDPQGYAVALVEVRTWANLAILADVWPSGANSK